MAADKDQGQTYEQHTKRPLPHGYLRIHSVYRCSQGCPPRGSSGQYPALTSDARGGLGREADLVPWTTP